ncbi:MAG TPA: adenylate cyclase regulatory domain-containing protein [Mycobacteriales bacterium]|nr:adenylate cyclase regulatory domain-containing protein [Mycobacteriales bacterium]
MDLQALQEAGLYDPADESADARLELLEFLDSEGCTLEEMQVAATRGRLFALAGDRRIRPLVGLLSLKEAGERLEADPAHLQRVWRTLGLPSADTDAPLLTDGDVEALQTYLDVRAFLGEETALGVARVIGAALARVSEAESSAMRVGMEVIDLARSSSEVETARAFSAVSRLVPRIGQMLDAVHRQHLEATRVHFEGIDVGDRAAFRCGVGFADLSGFTHLSHHLELAELSQVLTIFEEQTTDTVQAHGGRIVKFLGDAVMWVSAVPGDLARIAYDLVTHPRAAMEGIDVRAGVAYGLVLAQDGDYFGTPVNLASRLVARAEPGEVLTAGDLVDVLGVEWSAVPGEEATLRGFHDAVPVFTLTPA